ncbi:arylsulfatase [Robiginitalea sp. SC105]|nr:arylsulfatase [Robiginitalea sp. SC105]
MLPVLFSFAVSCQNAPERQVPDTRPNILLLVADDLGYSDLGSFGGEIPTPNLDRLAASGVRFSRFHTAPMCAPTRAMLLSGNDNHIAGVGRQAAQFDVFGYEGYLTDRVATVPELLRESGYATMMAGKWHLGGFPEANPRAKGFDRSFVLLEGVGNHFNNAGIFGDGSESHYTENGRTAQWPAGQYSTDFYTEKLLGYLEENHGTGKPFFAYAAFTAPHWPLQVASAHWKKFEPDYRDGYEALRKRRLAGLKREGLIAADSSLPLFHPDIPAWDSLTAEEKERETRKMAIYAGMVENLDLNIGRILEYLESTGEFENTLILFLSDNGAAGEDYFSNPEIRPYINSYYSDDTDRMGEPDSFISYGPPWAEAATGPFRYFKGYTTRGGILAPLIVSGPGVTSLNAIAPAITTVMDIAPTLFSAGGISYPKKWKGSEVYPLRGASLWPVLTDAAESPHPDDYVFAMEHAQYGMVQKGRWKIANTQRPLNRSRFELYDLGTDPGEQHDLKDEAPEIFSEMMDAWEDYAREVRLQLPE